jgi:hypothetical protein
MAIDFLLTLEGPWLDRASRFDDRPTGVRCLPWPRFGWIPWTREEDAMRRKPRPFPICYGRQQGVPDGCLENPDVFSLST